MSVPDLFKIVSRGLQDKRLQPDTEAIKGKPETTRYVRVYKATTRWAARFYRVDFDTAPDFGIQASVTLPRQAEFLHRLFLCVTLPDIYGIQLQAAFLAGDTSLRVTSNKFLGPIFSWCNSVGHAIIDRITLEIGGVSVATLDGRLLEVLDELYEPPEKLALKNTMIGRVENYDPLALLASGQLKLQIPLPFWFTQHLAQSLPIGALSVDTVRCQVVFRPLEELYSTTARISELSTDEKKEECRPSGSMPRFQGAKFYKAVEDGPLIFRTDSSLSEFGVPGEEIKGIQIPSKIRLDEAYLLAEYISVDDFEASNLRTSDLEYKVPLYNSLGPVNTGGQPVVRAIIPFNNPTQDLLWYFHNPLADLYNAYFLATRDLSGTETSFVPWNLDGTGFRFAFSEPISEVALFYNGTQRFHHTQPSLFRSLIPVLHYRKAPVFWRYIYAYPFGLSPGVWNDPELGNAYQPRGLANFDKLSRKEIVFTMEKSSSGEYPPLNLYLWTTTWNVLRIFGGRAAFLFAL